MATEYTEEIYEAIEACVLVASRQLGRGVLPRDVQAMLPYARAEGSVRRDMLNMAQAGRLVRLYGEGCRRGYRLPTRMERMAFSIIDKMPMGAEQLTPSAVKCAIWRERPHKV